MATKRRGRHDTPSPSPPSTARRRARHDTPSPPQRHHHSDRRDGRSSSQPDQEKRQHYKRPRSLSASRSPRRDNGHDRRKPQDRGDNRTENGGNEDVRHRREGSKGHRKEKKKKSGKKKSRKIDRDKSDKRNNRQGLDVRISPKEKRRKRERSRSCSSSSVTSSTRPVSPAHHQNASDTVKTSSGEEQAASTTATPASLTVDQRGTRENSGRDGETQPEEERASVDEDAPTPPASPGVASKKAELSVASAPSKTSFFEQLRAMEGRKGSVGTMHATGNSASVGVSGASGGGGVIQSSDWECLKCGKSNYKNASACDRCHALKRMTLWRD